MDKILIKDLLVRCVIGVSPEERREKQELRFNVALWTDLRAAARSDRIEDAVNIREVERRIFALGEESEHRLLEALAERVATVCLVDPRVRRVQVEVEKPSALRFTRGVAVQIVRSAMDRYGNRLRESGIEYRSRTERAAGAPSARAFRAHPGPRGRA